MRIVSSFVLITSRLCILDSSTPKRIKEEANKYWLREEDRKCIFCNKELDNLEYYIGECSRTKGWFEDIGKNKKEIVKWLGDENLDKTKAHKLNLWKERDMQKVLKEKTEHIIRGNK